MSPLHREVEHGPAALKDKLHTLVSQGTRLGVLVPVGGNFELSKIAYKGLRMHDAELRKVFYGLILHKSQQVVGGHTIPRDRGSR
jgi:hypothetical protein